MSRHDPISVQRSTAGLVLAATVLLPASAEALPCWRLPDPPPDCEIPEPEEDVDYPPPWQPPTYAGDDDRDGLADIYENHLLARFSPRIWLHYQESSRPTNVDELLAHSTLRYSHSYCSDHQILPWYSVDRHNLAQQVHQDTNWWCSHSGPPLSSAYHVGGTKDTFFLQFDDAAQNGIWLPDPTPVSRRRWDIYGHVYPGNPGEIVVQFWQLYGYNDSFASANHEGDWEYTAVVVDAYERPLEVVYYRHGRDEPYLPEEIEWIDGTHHVTFSSKGGHGQYHKMDDGILGGDQCVDHGRDDQAQGFADRCSRGFQWDTWSSNWGDIINVGEVDYPLNGSAWIQYSGLWGEIGAASDVISFTSGPRGPAYKGSWTYK